MSLRMGPAIRPEGEPEFRGRAFRIGMVKEQDSSNARVRVGFAEFDQMISYWLSVVVPKSQNDKMYWMPDIGEQVVCLMDERDEAGVVLGAIYSSADQPPVSSADKYHLGFKDNTTIEYDRGVHVLAITFSDQTNIRYDAASHEFALAFADGATIAYQMATHVLSIAGSGTTSAIVSAPAGIVLQAGNSQVTIAPSGISVTPPLPLSSTVAQT